MQLVLPFRVLALGSLLLAGAAALGQRKDCDIKAPTDSSCAPPPKPTPAPAPAPSTTSQFPYPGDAPGSPAPDKGTSTPASKQFPYPGSAGSPTDEDGLGKSSTSSSSSSSSSTSSSSSAPDGADNAKPADPDDPLDPGNNAPQPTGRRKLPKVKELQSPEDREAEDVKVAGFYFDQGNNLAAYNRLRDAVKLVADDADAWYLLGEASAKLHKQDESLEAYRRFLSLETGTRRAKALTKERPELRAAR